MYLKHVEVKSIYVFVSENLTRFVIAIWIAICNIVDLYSNNTWKLFWGIAECLLDFCLYLKSCFIHNL